MNSSVISILLSCLAGLFLGGAYFAGLWWTVQRSATACHPGLLLTGSYFIRAGLLAGGIMLAGGRDWQNLLSCMTGLLAARLLACRWVTSSRSTREPLQLSKEREGGIYP